MNPETIKQLRELHHSIETMSPPGKVCITRDAPNNNNFLLAFPDAYPLVVQEFLELVWAELPGMLDAVGVWHDAKNDPPPEPGEYLIIDGAGVCVVASWLGEGREDGDWDVDDYGRCTADYWMPLPPLPKEKP